MACQRVGALGSASEGQVKKTHYDRLHRRYGVLDVGALLSWQDNQVKEWQEAPV